MFHGAALQEVFGRPRFKVPVVGRQVAEAPPDQKNFGPGFRDSDHLLEHLVGVVAALQSENVDHSVEFALGKGEGVAVSLH